MPKKKENLSPEERLKQALIPKEEELYKLPDNWVWTRLIGYFAECLDNFRKPINATERAKRKGNIPYYGATGQVGVIDDYLLEGEFILLGEDGAPFLEPLKNKAYKIKGKAWVNNHAHVLRSFFGEIGNEYMLHYLNIFDYKDYVNGTTRLKLTQEKMKKICIPLPPLNEQKRIVEKLDSLFEKTGKIKEVIEEVKEKTFQRREAVLSKAFTGELTEKWRAENKTENAKELLLRINEEKLKNNSKAKIKDISEMLVNEDEIPYKVPDNWVWTRLGDITNYGEVKQIKAEDISENDWILELEDIEKGTFKLLNRVLKKERQNKSNKHVFFKGDILYSKLRPYLNKILIAEEDGYATTEIIPFKGLFNLDNKYIFYYFTFSKTIEMINFLTHGMQMPRLGTDKAKNLLFPLPPLEEQKEIVRILDKIFEEEEKISELISIENQVEILEKTILDKAFRGELGTGNIDDEPALELLKKVIK